MLYYSTRGILPAKAILTAVKYDPTEATLLSYSMVRPMKCHFSKLWSHGSFTTAIKVWSHKDYATVMI